MKLADSSPEVIEKIKNLRYDQILEKHEGPWDWASEFKYGDPEFLMVQDWAVLLPIHQEHHSNISVLRTVMSENSGTLTLFLKDMTYVSDPEWENFEAGRVAICEKMPGENFYVALLYHEWFIVDNLIFSEH
jgi:hypothetical protein